MAEHRSTAEEAADPGTSPERLLELTEKHPQLHRLIVMNPSAPEVARQWILATNQWAKQAYESGAAVPAQDASRGAAGDAAGGPADEDDDLDEGEPTQLHQAVPDEGPAPSRRTDEQPAQHAPVAAPAPRPEHRADASHDAPQDAPQPEDEPDDSVSAWGDYPEELVWGTAAGATGAAATGAAAQGADSPYAQADALPAPPAPVPAQPESAAQSSPGQGSPSSSVRLSPTASVVPLGAAPAQTGPATRPMAPVAASAAAGAGAAPSWGPAEQQGPAGQQSAAGSQGPATAPAPVGPPPGNEDDADDGSRKKAWIACGGCLVLALVLLLVIGLGARALLAPDEEEYQRDSTTTSAEAAPEQTTPEETEEATPEDPVSPAPEDAEERNELLSPTGNISCLLEEDSVSCSVVDRDFSEEGLEDCEDGPFSITVAGEGAERACGSSFLSDSAQTLEYDRSAVRGDVACTSRFDGMTCWNTMTGKGFTVNRVGYETF